MWLSARNKTNAAPIGLYFAMLWYDEELYPLIYSVEALRKFVDKTNKDVQPGMISVSS